MKLYKCYLVSEELPKTKGFYKVIHKDGYMGNVLYDPEMKELTEYWKKNITTWIK